MTIFEMLAHFSEPPPKLLGLSDYFRTAFRKSKKVEKRPIHNPYSRHRPRHFSRLGDQLRKYKIVHNRLLLLGQLLVVQIHCTWDASGPLLKCLKTSERLER